MLSLSLGPSPLFLATGSFGHSVVSRRLVINVSYLQETLGCLPRGLFACNVRSAELVNIHADPELSLCSASNPRLLRAYYRCE